MLFSSVLVAIILACLSILCHQTMGRFLPINVDLLPRIGQRRASDGTEPGDLMPAHNPCSLNARPTAAIHRRRSH